MENLEIEILKNEIVKKLLPLKIYLFGSYANGNFTEESDYDFYIVVSDSVTDLAKEAAKAYKAVRFCKSKPVDIVVGTEQRFEARKNRPSVESEVYSKGVLLYESRS